ncbi:MAG: hypothetical protein KDD64_03975 [Bdellovibrionales bacterium]|nr:hypothetical protein [Bdellovibrionales bacterium]
MKTSCGVDDEASRLNIVIGVAERYPRKKTERHLRKLFAAFFLGITGFFVTAVIMANFTSSLPEPFSSLLANSYYFVFTVLALSFGVFCLWLFNRSPVGRFLNRDYREWKRNFKESVRAGEICRRCRYVLLLEDGRTLNTCPECGTEH